MLRRTSSSSSMGSSRSIKNAELIASTQNSQLNNWTIPSIAFKAIYKTGMFNFISQDNIKTAEQDISLDNHEQTLKLLSLKDVDRYLQKYKYLHIGCIQVAFKPLTLHGLNASILAYLRDARCLDFIPSLMGIIQTSLCHGPVYFDVYPNLTLSLTDRNLFDAVTLKVQTQGYNYMQGSDTISVSYRIYFKVMNTLCPKAILRSDPGKTVVIESNSLTTNVAVPRLITWEEVDFPDEWKLPQAVPAQALTNNQVEQIVQTPDGDVEVSFAPDRVSRLSRHILSRSRSTRETPLPYRVSIPRSRASTSDLPHQTQEEPQSPLHQEPRVQGLRFSEQQIPHGIYHDSEPFENPFASRVQTHRRATSNVEPTIYT